MTGRIGEIAVSYRGGLRRRTAHDTSPVRAVRRSGSRAVGGTGAVQIAWSGARSRSRLSETCSRHDVLAIRNNVEAAPSHPREPQDDVAVALANPSPKAQTVRRGFVEAKEIAPLPVTLPLQGNLPHRECVLAGAVGARRYGDGDQSENLGRSQSNSRLILAQDGL